LTEEFPGEKNTTVYGTETGIKHIKKYQKKIKKKKIARKSSKKREGKRKL